MNYIFLIGVLIISVLVVLRLVHFTFKGATPKGEKGLYLGGVLLFSLIAIASLIYLTGKATFSTRGSNKEVKLAKEWDYMVDFIGEDLSILDHSYFEPLYIFGDWKNIKIKKILVSESSNGLNIDKLEYEEEYEKEGNQVKYTSSFDSLLKYIYFNNEGYIKHTKKGDVEKKYIYNQSGFEQILKYRTDTISWRIIRENVRDTVKMYSYNGNNDKKIYTYLLVDKNGVLKEKNLLYDEDMLEGNTIVRTIYKIEEEGVLRTKNYYHNGLTWERLIKNGICIEDELINPETNKIISSRRCIVDWDKQGNWLHWVYFEEYMPVSVCLKEITFTDGTKIGSVDLDIVPTIDIEGVVRPSD